MIKIIITISLFLTYYPNLFAQWSTDPNNNLIVGYGWDPHIVSDSAGGCYVTYNYESFYPQKLAVERLDMYGYKPWGTKKQILGELPEQWQAEIVEDGEGGVIVSYQDNEVIGTDYITRVRVQRIDSNGNFLWGQTGVRVSIEEKTHGAQELVNDGEGGCVVLWQDNIGKYYINRISGEGERVWGDSGKVIGTSAYTGMRIISASDDNYYVETGEYIYRIRQNGEIVRRDSVTLGYIVPDPEGGILLSGRVWTGMIPKLVAQRKDSLGNNLWQEPYVEIADSLHINTMLSIMPYRGYYFYGWMGKKNGNNEILQIQGLRKNGTILYNQGSIPLNSNPGETTYIPIIPSDSGSCLFISSYANGTFGQKIDTLGLLKWNSNQVLLNYPQIGLDRSFVTTDCVGGAIGLGEYLTDFAIPVFKVSAKGILGEIITFINVREEEIIPSATILHQNFPNPFNSFTIIKYQIQDEGNVKISLYNILGEKLKIISNEYKSTGTHSIIFNSDYLSSGVYIYTLEINNKTLTKKLTILK